MTAATQWLLDWFAEHKGLTQGSAVERLRTDYFQSGLLDSFGVMEFIGAVEDHFALRFTDRDFQDRRFSTIGGLGELIEGKSLEPRCENA